MKPTKQLILAFRTVANDLKSNCRYSWSDSTHCNCGLLIRALTGIPSRSLRSQLNIIWRDVKLFVGGGVWSVLGNHWNVCKETGLPMHKLMQELETYGLEPRDLEAIEYLDDPEHHTDRAFVADWFERKADQLEQERKTCMSPERSF